MSNQSAADEECISPELGRAADSLRSFALFSIVFNVVAVVTGVVFWYYFRENLFLQRRNPIISFFLIFALMGNLFSGPIYRWTLNDDDSFFAQCFFGNFMFVVTIPTLLIPNVVKIASFHYRVKLHQMLSNLQADRQKQTEIHSRTMATLNSSMNEKDVSTTTPAYLSPPKNPVMFKESAIFDDDEYSTIAADEEFLKLRALKYKAGSRFSINCAFVLLAISMVSAMFYAALSCPSFIQGSKCEFGFVSSAAVFIAIPVVFMLLLYCYFAYLVQKVPDPFEIRSEINQFFGLNILGIVIMVFGFADLGGQNNSTEGLIYFKHAELLDVLIVVIFIHAIHYQVYKSIVQSRNLLFQLNPVSFEEMLNHAEGVKLFEAFLQTIFSVETLKCYEILIQWRENFDDDVDNHRRLNQARNIFRRWLDPDHPDSIKVNVADRSLRSVQQLIKSTGPLKKNLFDELIQDLKSLMATDCFPRFARTEEYHVFVGAQDPKVEDI